MAIACCAAMHVECLLLAMKAHWLLRSLNTSAGGTIEEESPRVKLYQLYHSTVRHSLCHLNQISQRYSSLLTNECNLSSHWTSCWLDVGNTASTACTAMHAGPALFTCSVHSSSAGGGACCRGGCRTPGPRGTPQHLSRGFCQQACLSTHLRTGRDLHPRPPFSNSTCSHRAHLPRPKIYGAYYLHFIIFCSIPTRRQCDAHMQDQHPSKSMNSASMTQLLWLAPGNGLPCSLTPPQPAKWPRPVKKRLPLAFGAWASSPESAASDCSSWPFATDQTPSMPVLLPDTRMGHPAQEGRP